MKLFFAAVLPLLAADPAFLDPDTPEAAYKSSVISSSQEPPFDLVFSDEFNEEGRRFAEGLDKKWTAINSYNPSTHDLEAYVSDQAYTQGGKLIIEVSDDIAVDPSGTPRPYSSAMLQTWNRACFQGGILEVSVKLPGSHDRPGLWPAAWMLGNLGRVGFGKSVPGIDSPTSNEGFWPWSYDSCLNASFPHFMPPNVHQKFDACTAKSRPWYCETHGYTPEQCAELQENKALLGPHGRGITEIDLIEVGVNKNGMEYKAELSTSLQIAPATGENGWVERNGRCYDQMVSNMSFGPETQLNDWSGAYGTEVISGLTELSQEHYDQQVIYRLEWLPDDRLAWYIRRPTESDFVPLFQIKQGALEACGPHGVSYRTERRPLPREPSYLLLNVALANDFSPVPAHDPDFLQGFPYRMEVDYVRFYQHPSAGNDLACDTKDFPTAAFIEKNRRLFENPDQKDLEVTCQPSSCHGTGPASDKPESSSGDVWFLFYDTRCPQYGQVIPSGCMFSEFVSLSCRQCYPRSVFEKLAMTEHGVIGNGTRNYQTNPVPICPPCACQQYGLSEDECSPEVLPGAQMSEKGCRSLLINGRSRRYCSNAAKNTAKPDSFTYV